MFIFLFNFISIFFLILFSKSGTGYLYFLFYIILKYKVLIFPAIILFLIFLVDIDMQFENNRGLDAILQISNFENLPQTSGIYKRLYDFKLGLHLFFNFPFGFGLNNVHLIYRYINFKDMINYVDNQAYGFNSSLTFWIGSYGSIFIFLFYFILFSINRPRFIHIFFSFLFISISYSAAYPAIWILLSLNQFKNSHEFNSTI